MAKQTITVRLDEDDLTYLSTVEVAGATTVSDKLRAFLADARRQREGMRDYGAAHDFARRLFAAPERCLRDAEVQAETRSELLSRVLSFLPEATALVLSGACAAARPARDRAESLARFERAVGERVLSFVDSLLQLNASGFAGCYDPPALVRRAESVHRILGIAALASGSANEEDRP